MGWRFHEIFQGLDKISSKRKMEGEMSMEEINEIKILHIKENYCLICEGLCNNKNKEIKNWTKITESDIDQIITPKNIILKILLI